MCFMQIHITLGSPKRTHQIVATALQCLYGQTSVNLIEKNSNTTELNKKEMRQRNNKQFSFFTHIELKTSETCLEQLLYLKIMPK